MRVSCGAGAPRHPSAVGPVASVGPPRSEGIQVLRLAEMNTVGRV